MKFLLFASEQAAKDAFVGLMEEGVWPSYIGTVAVDVVGVIYKPTGVVLEDGVQELKPVPGWHVNLSERVPELEQFEIEPPVTPARIFGGAVWHST